MSVSESIGPLVYPHRDCAKAKHRSPSEGAKPTGHSFKPMIACCRVGLASVIGQGWLGLPVAQCLPLGMADRPGCGKHSAASQNCLAYGKGRVRSKCQHLPPCRGAASAVPWASPQLLGMGAALASASAAVGTDRPGRTALPCCGAAGALCCAVSYGLASFEDCSLTR